MEDAERNITADIPLKLIINYTNQIINMFV